MIKFPLKKVISKVVIMIIICFLAFSISALCILYILNILKGTVVYGFNNFYQAIVIVPLIVIIFIFWFLILKRLAFSKVGRIIIATMSVMFVMRYTIFIPFRVINGDVGPYRQGELVFSYLRYLYPSRSISKNKIVVFRSDTLGEGKYHIGIIEEIGSDGLVQKSYMGQDNIPVLEITHGDYLIKYGEKKYGILDSAITSIIWFPFRQ